MLRGVQAWRATIGKKCLASPRDQRGRYLSAGREDQLIHGYRSSTRCSMQHAELLQRQPKLMLQMAGNHISRVLNSHLA